MQNSEQQKMVISFFQLCVTGHRWDDITVPLAIIVFPWAVYKGE